MNRLPKGAIIRHKYNTSRKVAMIIGMDDVSYKVFYILHPVPDLVASTADINIHTISLFWKRVY